MSDKKETKTSAPIFRSVMVAPPMMGIPPPVPMGVSIQQKQKTAPILRGPKAQSQGSWDIADAQVPSLPSYLPLERSHVWLKDVAGDVLAQRIADCLKYESIAAVFDADNAVAVAETSDNVKFNVRLFKRSGTGIVVEIQRRCGCCFRFREAARAVLLAAMGRKPEVKRTHPVPTCILEDHDVDEKVLDEAVEIASSLLSENRLDENLLGAESLVHLTSDVEAPASHYVSRKIMNGSAGVTEKLFSFIQTWTPVEEDQSVGGLDQSKMQRFALSIVGNSLCSLSTCGELVGILSKDDVVSERILQPLVHILSTAVERPHDACDAARCLSALLQCSQKFKLAATSFGIQEAMLTALSEGECRHSKLAEESKILQEHLESR